MEQLRLQNSRLRIELNAISTVQARVMLEVARVLGRQQPEPDPHKAVEELVQLANQLTLERLTLCKQSQQSSRRSELQVSRLYCQLSKLMEDQGQMRRREQLLKSELESSRSQASELQAGLRASDMRIQQLELSESASRRQLRDLVIKNQKLVSQCERYQQQLRECRLLNIAQIDRLENQHSKRRAACSHLKRLVRLAFDQGEQLKEYINRQIVDAFSNFAQNLADFVKGIKKGVTRESKPLIAALRLQLSKQNQEEIGNTVDTAAFQKEDNQNCHQRLQQIRNISGQSILHRQSQKKTVTILTELQQMRAKVGRTAQQNQRLKKQLAGIKTQVQRLVCQIFADLDQLAGKKKQARSYFKQYR